MDAKKFGAFIAAMRKEKKRLLANGSVVWGFQT